MARLVYCIVFGVVSLFNSSTFGGFNFKILANVNDSNAGLSMDAGGDLFGTTRSGVFELANGAHSVSGIGGPINGQLAGGVTVDTNGNVYGATANNGDGLVFEVAAVSHTTTTIAILSGTGGQMDQGGPVVDSAGNVYGTEEFGGGGPGAVYEVPYNKHSSSSYALTEVSFLGNSGEDPISGLILDSAGNLFGTAAYGSPHGGGSVFEIPAISKNLTLLAGLGNGNNGPNHPETDLVFNSAGDLFGTTTNGGTDGIGDVFEVSAGNHNVSELAQFDTVNGSFPLSDLVCDASGDLFGTTEAGGDYGVGTLYEIVSGSNTITTLVSFNGTDGSNPIGNLVQDSQGNIYGVATSTLFEFSPAVPEPSSFALATIFGAICFLRKGRD